MGDERRLIENAQDDLTEIAEWWAEILADRFPGTRRRWHQRRDDPERAQERAERDAAERAERFGQDSSLPTHLRPKVTDPPGFAASPARDDVLDIVADVTWSVIELRDAIAEHLNGDRRRVGVAQACTWVASALPALQDRTLLEHSASEARRLVGRARTATGRVEDTIELAADCPICGKRSLLAWAERVMVECTSSGCRCDRHDCPCQQGWPHRWTELDLVWLSRIIGGDTQVADSA